MKYYVWLEYYLAPASKNVKSTELKFYDGHQHGVAPSQDQVDSLQSDLQITVQQAATAKTVAYPGDAAVLAGRTVKTRSER